MARRRRNPQANILPHMDPEFPIRPRVDARSGRCFTVLCVPVNKNRYAATIAEDQSVRVTAPTRRKAEDDAAKLFLAKQRTNPDEMAEDELLGRVAEKADKTRHYPIERLFKKYGHLLEG